VIQAFQQNFDKFYVRKENELKTVLFPFIQKVKDDNGDKYRNVAVPFSDGRARVMNIGVRIDAALESEGDTIMRDIERAVTLAVIDEKWKEHLRAMDELKTSVQAASFEQKDPLVKYKMEAYELFEQFIYLINEEVTGFLSAGRIMVQAPENGQAGIPAAPQRARRPEPRRAEPKLQAGRGESPQEAMARKAAENAGGGAGRRKAEPVQTMRRDQPKVGRNEKCPCGSGKKFKQCHGR